MKYIYSNVVFLHFFSKKTLSHGPDVHIFGWGVSMDLENMGYTHGKSVVSGSNTEIFVSPCLQKNSAVDREPYDIHDLVNNL